MPPAGGHGGRLGAAAAGFISPAHAYKENAHLSFGWGHSPIMIHFCIRRDGDGVLNRGNCEGVCESALPSLLRPPG